MTTRPAGMYVGENTRAEDHGRNGTALGIDPSSLSTHGVIVGMTGSGKTGLGIVMLEEALAQDIPVLVLDPKGDMGNLLLTFPELAPSDFAPWVPAGEDPATVAAIWSSGLADWGIERSEISALRDSHHLTVYTPGSTAGVPLDIIGSLAPPRGDDAETIRDEVESIVQGLLGLVGVTSDPMSGREHVLMANLIESAWAAGETLDLATLLVRIQDPPMRKLGVIEIDTYFPRADRVALMLRLNGLLASPSFAAWGSGAPLDIEAMLWQPDGRANAAIVYMAHLSDEERQMVVTRVLSKLVGWMRTQSGSTTLRVLVYMDEVVGFVPPTANPPSKKPILTLFKQARAFGVGVVLATQNPVDLDYKAISNAGTWMVGRLQTERDKARLLEGMTSAAGTVDIAAIDATISSLAKREFLLHTTGGSPPTTFGVRWAMSYLCGPLSNDQIRMLPGQPSATPTEAPAPAAPSTALTTAPPTSPSTESAPIAGGPLSTLSDDESPSPPTSAAGIAVRYLDPAAPWAAQVGAVPGGRRLRAAIAVRLELLYDDTTSSLRETETWEAIFFPLGTSVSASDAISVDYDDRDLVETQPQGSVFVVPDAPIRQAKFFTALQADLKNRLVAEHTTSVLTNPGLKLFSRPGEDREAFAARCSSAADAAADTEADKIRKRLAPKIGHLHDAITAAQQRADQLKAQESTSRASEAFQVGGSVLGALFGGRKSASSIAGAVNRAASGRARSQRVGDRAEMAMARIEEKSTNLADLEQQLTDELTDLTAHWSEVAGEIEELEIPLEKNDITVSQVAVVWIPTAS